MVVRARTALSILVLLLSIGGVFFGTLVFYFEEGDWTYVEDANPPRFMYVRADGNPSPFTSIPASIWWFLATVTTVGYGEIYPISAPGKIVAVFAMLTGLMVLAYPVSVFTDLWSEELHARGHIGGDDANDNSGSEGCNGAGKEAVALVAETNANTTMVDNGSYGINYKSHLEQRNPEKGGGIRGGAKGKVTLDAEDLAQLLWHVQKAQEIIEKAEWAR